MYSVLLEVRTDIIPASLQQKVHTRTWRKQLLKKCGKKAFLRPEDLAFPVMTDDCKYHCGLLFAAYLRASEYHYFDIAKKAAELYRKNNCEKKLGIRIRKEF